MKFKRQFQRKCKPDEPNVVTLQDVKDVAFFVANPKDLTLDLVNYFHIPTMDRFLRALIIYFQYYLQVLAFCGVLEQNNNTISFY